MKLEAVIVCKDYGDFLEHTLPNNLQHLDRVVVVTHPEDKRTRSLCDKFGVDCVDTTVFNHDGDRFNKWRGLNLGLGHIKGSDWILVLDADIYLPHRFRDMLQRHNLDPKCIYGADRANVYGYDHWMNHKHKTVPHYSHRYFVEPPREFPLGARIVHYEHGWLPIGYFQLFHKSSGRRFPLHVGNAEHGDVLFAVQWARQHRILLPEVIVYHLDSHTTPQPMGANWNGRKTPLFGCSPNPNDPPGYCPVNPNDPVEPQHPGDK